MNEKSLNIKDLATIEINCIFVFILKKKIEKEGIKSQDFGGVLHKMRANT